MHLAQELPKCNEFSLCIELPGSTEQACTKEKSSSSNGTSSSKDPQEAKRDANWFDVGIIKGSSCTVSSYYLPSGDGERPEIDVEGMHIP